MSNQERTQTFDPLTQAPEPQSVEPEVAPRTLQRPSAHPMDRLQRAAGNRFVGARLARQAEGTAPPQPGPGTWTALESASVGRPLPPTVRASMELALGADFSDVRIHLDPSAEEGAGEMNALAFTVGKDIFFRQAAYAPESPAGRDLIAQELAHTLQQPAGAGLDLMQVDAPPRDPLAEQMVEVEEFVAEEITLEAVREPEEELALEDAGPEETPPEPEMEAVEEEPAEERAAEEEAEPAEVEVETVEPPTSARPDIELIMPEPPGELSPESEARVVSSQGAATRAGTAVRKLPSAEASTAEARGAVTEPETETAARAESRLAEALGTRSEPSPEIVELCQAIRESIREKRPVDEDDLVEAEPEEMAAAAGAELNESVEGDTERVQGSYDELNEPQPGAPELTPEAIETPPEEVAPPDIGAEEAVPDAILPEDVSLQADLDQTDADIEAAGLNSEPAQLVQEGPIAEARAARGELSETAQTGPAEVLAAQDAALQEASADMVALQEQALVALSSSRAGTVTGVSAQQNEMVGSEEQIREQLSTRSTEIFTTAQTQVNDLLRPLPETAMEKWEAGVARFSTEFRQSLDRVQRWIDERHSGVGGTILAGWDALTGLPGWVTEEYDRAEQKFGDDVCGLIMEISAEVNSVIAACEAIIDDARQQIDDLFSQELPEGLREWAAGERERIKGQLDGLQDQVTATRDNFNRDLSRRAVQAVREVQEEVQQLREAAKGLIGRIKDAIGEFLADPLRAIINGLLSLVGISPAAFWALVNKIEQAISDIADDPMKFINNLVAAIGEGFKMFFDNIGMHLLQGLLDWLFSGLGSIGVQIPGDLSLKSAVTFFLQLMGLTWPNIRQILVRHVGEKNVALIERVWELVSTLIEQGPEGIFEMIKQQLDPQQILDQVLDAAIDFVIEALIKNVTVRIIALFNPVGAIVQAIELIYRILKWVFENAARIFTFIETVVNGIADIIAGNISGMAGAVERALAMLIPPVIDFLAGFVGLGDLPDKVVETVKKLQAWVLSIVDRVVGWFVEQGRRLLAALGIGREERPAGAEGDTDLGTSVSFSAAGETHRQWVEIVGTDAVLMVSSDGPGPVEEKLEDWSRRLPEHRFAEGDQGRTEAEGLISSAQVLLGQADTEADSLALAFQRANEVRGEDAPEIPSDDPLEAKQQALSSILQRLYQLFGEKPDLTVLYAEQLAQTDPYARPVITEALMSRADELKEAKNWEDIKKRLNEKSPVKDLVETPLNISHTFGLYASKDQAIPALLNALAASNVEEKFIGNAETYVRYRKQFIHAGNRPFVNSRTQLAIQVYQASNKGTAIAKLREEFTARLNNDKFAHLNRADVRAALEAAASTAPPGWAAVFATGGRQLRGKTLEGQEYNLNLLIVWDRNGISLDNVIQITSDAIEQTIRADKQFMERIRGIETPGEIASDLATDMVFGIARTPLFFVRQTDIPRNFVEGPHLIRNPDVSASQARYTNIAASAREKALSDLNGQIHHFVPLYLAGGSEVANLVRALGGGSQLGTAHQALHQFIDNLQIGSALGVQNAYTLDWNSLDAAFPDDTLVILIGTIMLSGSISYRETDPKLAYIVSKDEKGFP